MSLFRRKEKVDFTGVAAGATRKQAITILVIEIVVIIILSGGVFAALNYFRIFPLSEMNPTLFGWLPQGKSSSDQLIKTDEQGNNYLPAQLKTKSTDKNISKSMVASSEVPGYELSLDNKDILIEFINQWDIFGSGYNVPTIGNTQATPVGTISVNLVKNDLGRNGYKNKQGEYYLSSDLKINPGQIDVFVYLSDDILTSSRSATEKGDFVTTGVVSALYRLEEYIMGIRPPEGMDPIFIELNKLGKHYFAVTENIEE